MMTTESSDEDLCQVCQTGRAEHTKLEEVNALRHQFSEHGELLRTPEKKKEDKVPRPIIQIMPAPDLALRALLKARGILSDEDLAALDQARMVIKTEVPRDQHNES